MITGFDLNKFIAVPGSDLESIGVGISNLSSITTGTNNLVLGLGTSSDGLTTGSNNLLIGTGASSGNPTTTAANQFWLSGGATAIMTATNINTTPVVTIPGSLTVSGALTTSSTQNYSSATGITAGTTRTQAGATALTKQINRVDTSTAPSAGTILGDGVKLPAASAGSFCVVTNNTANPIQVYGNGSDTINGVAAATGITMPPNTADVYWAAAAGSWQVEAGFGYSGQFTTQLAVSGVTAAGTTQATATPLTAQLAVVSTVASGTGVNLPGVVVSTTTQSAGVTATIVNNGVNPLLVYPPQGATSDTINGQAATAGFSVFPGTVANFSSAVNGTWFADAATTKMSASNSVASAASLTLTAAQLTGGAADVALTITGATTVTSLTTDTAANILKALHSPVVGTSYKLRIINVVGTATSALTGGSGVTVSSVGSGVVTIPATGWREFIVTVTAVGTPAVTMVSTSTGTWS